MRAQNILDKRDKREFVEAIEDCNRAIELDPKYAPARSDLGKMRRLDPKLGEVYDQNQDLVKTIINRTIDVEGFKRQKK